VDPQIFAWAKSELPGKPCVVIVNSDGGKDVLLATLRSYAQFVSPDSYLVVAGIQPGGKAARTAPDAAALAAMRQFLSEPAGKEFSPDESRALFITTWNSGGWLKRKGAQAQ
jgi:cephalosporin hydroxylase